MNYTLHQIQVFLKVCELQSITKASEALHLTQPAVSLQLKKLQDQFDLPLTEIIGRRVHITDFGWKIAEAGKKIVDEVQEIELTVKRYKGVLGGSIKISVVSTGKYVLPFFLTEFVRKHSGINISIDVTNKSKVIKSIENGQTDFALVSVMPKDLDIHHIELMPNQLFLVGSTNQPPLPKSKINMKNLSNLPYIFRENGSATRQVMENYLQHNGVEATPKLELVSNEATKQAVIAGLGYSIMPLIGMQSELKTKRLTIHKLKGLPIITHWNLIYRKSKKLNPAELALIEHIQEKKKRIIEKHFTPLTQVMQ